MKRRFFLVLFLVAICLASLPFAAESQQSQKPKPGSEVKPGSGPQAAAAYPAMPEPGKKVAVGSDYYFVYGFDKKPKLGTAIMKVEVFTKEGKKDTSFEVKADSGMPSMRGAHDTGDRSFKLSNKGDYLLPIDIVMPGDWEVRLTILKDGKVVYRGSYQFSV